MPAVDVIHYTDPGCPWAYSASPALAALAWRYGDQLNWRHVMIGLAEDSERYESRGYTPLRMARSHVAFRRFGMPFAPAPKDHVAGTSRGCRAIIAVRLQAPEREWAALRACQFLQFTTPGTLDDDAALRTALAGVEGVDAEAAVAAIDSPAVLAAYEEDRAAARSAENTPAHIQGKTANTDGAERYTAPSVTFRRDAMTLVAGGFQNLQAYDVLLANLAPELERREAPEDISEVLAAFPDGLTTAEVAEVYATGPAQETDRRAIEDRLLEAAAEDRVTRVALGDDALWLPPAGVGALGAAGMAGAASA
jgi:protein-disulfide isomerase-like protein with CxxC motif